MPDYSWNGRFGFFLCDGIGGNVIERVGTAKMQNVYLESEEENYEIG